MARVEPNMWLVDNTLHRHIGCVYARVHAYLPIYVDYVHVIAMCNAREYLFTCIPTCHSIIISWFCYFQLANIVEFVTAQNNTNREFNVDVDSLNIRVDRELTRTNDMQGSLILLI